ncbi:MAG: T9SS type A sorting domain-containing protein [Gemmatimonadetes bacterium]|nr:T9SS type A sorting domain-containing protein [Gemmatimonadota bacterium]
MLRKKLLLRRLACVPWLLAVCLVLGWSGEAVALPIGTDTGEHGYDLTAGHTHSPVVGHTHATDPYLRVGIGLNPVTGAANDSVFVSWSTSYSKNFHSITGDRANGTAATTYTVSLFKGEIPDNPADAPITGDVSDGGSITIAGSREIAFTGPATDGTGVAVRRDTLIVDLEDTDDTAVGDNTGPGFYWVRIQVAVPDGDHTSDGNVVTETFARQVAVLPDYILSVNPTSVREDAGATNITVRVKVRDDGDDDDEDEKVDVDTSVPLRLGTNQKGLNSRFRIEFPTLTIRKGQKEAEGTIRFTPIYDNKTPDDDLLVTIRTTGALTAEGVTDIRMIDTDKASTAINLSFSQASLSKTDPATDIIVTATLNGKTQVGTMRFFLRIDQDYREEGQRTAERDVDYDDVLAPISIPSRRESGRTTISIEPKNEGVGLIRVIGSTPTDRDGKDVLVAGTLTPIRVMGSSIEITDDPAKAISGLTATPSSIREDAGQKEVKLEITLQNPLEEDETVRFSISDRIPGGTSANAALFEDAVPAERDGDYRATAPSLVIRAGETTGTVTMIVSTIDNEDEDLPRAFTVSARVGNNRAMDTGILITDDDTVSESITLEVSPDELTEGAGPTPVTVTGILNGEVFAKDVTVFLTINEDINGDDVVDGKDKAASRDLDYTTTLQRLVIPAGSTEGTTTFTIDPLADNLGEEGDEKIGLKSLATPQGEDEDGGIHDLTVSSVAITLKDASATADPSAPIDPTRLAFAVADSIASQSYVVGTAIDPLILPEARGGAAPLTYSVSTLPAGLSFDSATRTLSGTPTAETNGAATIIYTVIDAARAASVLIFTITVEEGVTPPPATDAQLSVTPSAIREDAGTTQVSLTVSLPEAKATDEIVTFTIVAPSEGTQAVRDVDYTASLGAIIAIPAGTTTGTATLTLTPINNIAVDSLRAIGVQATFASGATLMTDIKIVDDETPSTSIELSVNPHSIVEGSGNVEVTVTATLDGKALAENATVVVAIDATSTATRDVDYAALFNPLITISAGSIMGSTQFVIRIIDDDLAEGSETIKLIGVINGLMGDEAEITLSDQAPMTPPGDSGDSGDPGALAFADNTTIPNQEYTAGQAISPLVLPAASGGTAPLTYSVSALPAGLVFDSATRTISGTPETVDSAVSVIVIYTVIDSAGSAVALTFTITINKELDLGDLGDFFNFFGSGKVVPTDSHDLAAIREFVVGQRVEGIVLPEASGGTAPLTYSLSPALPAGLAFDAFTRTIAGTPSAEGATVYTYTVTDANGATASLALQTLPTAFSLADNFPNPFNPTTTIQYALPQAADVELTVYNVVGQPVRTLVAEHQSVGRYVVEWDATDDSGHSLSSGMYFYRLQAGEEFREVKKMLLLK